MSTRARLYLLYAQIFVFQAGFGLVIPLLPHYTRQFDVGEVGVGLVVAIYGLARVLTDLPAGALAGRLGHAKAMGLGAVILTVGSVATAFATTFAELLVCRFVAGAGAAITLVVGQSTAARYPGPYSQAKALSYYQAWFLAGVGIGPMLSGPLVSIGGQQAPFLVYGALATVVGVVGLALPMTGAGARDAAGESHGGVRHSLRLLLDVPFVLVSLITLMVFFTRTGGMQSLVPLLGTDDYGLTASLVGLAIGLNSVANLVVTFASGALMDRIDRRVLMVPGNLVIVLSMVLFALGDGAAAFVGAALLWGVGTGMAAPVTAAYVAERSRGDSTGALALYRAISDVGYLAGPLLMGWSAQSAGIPVTLLWCAALFLVAVVAFRVNLALRRRAEARTSAAQEAAMSAEPRITGPLAYEALGPLDAPRMVFVHPNPMDSSTWIHQMVHFSTWYRCIAVDLPGYGRSPQALEGVTMVDVADAVWDAVDREDSGSEPAEPAVLVGCSVGSHVVEHMYHRRPDRVSALVVSGTGWQPRREFAVRRAAQYREHGVAHRRAHALEDFSPAFRATPLAGWYADLVQERNATADAMSIVHMFEARVAQDPDEFYTRLQAPVLVVTGSLDSAHPGVAPLAERLPDCRVRVLEGAGHACYFERPVEFDDAVVEFLAGLPAAPAGLPVTGVEVA